MPLAGFLPLSKTYIKPNGLTVSLVFVLKVFDVFLQPTVELIYLLSCFYEHVYIVKPNTSRYANSEKYVVCKKFKYEKTDEITQKFISIFCVFRPLEAIFMALYITFFGFFFYLMVEISFGSFSSSKKTLRPKLGSQAGIGAELKIRECFDLIYDNRRS